MENLNHCESLTNPTLFKLGRSISYKRVCIHRQAEVCVNGPFNLDNGEHLRGLLGFLLQLLLLMLVIGQKLRGKDKMQP